MRLEVENIKEWATITVAKKITYKSSRQCRIKKFKKNIAAEYDKSEICSCIWFVVCTLQQYTNIRVRMYLLKKHKLFSRWIYLIIVDVLQFYV